MRELNNAHASTPQAADVLAKATLRAAHKLGLSRPELTGVIGRDRSSISRGGITPDSKSGELATLLVRCYRSLAVLFGGNEAQIKAWMQADNRHLGGTPLDLMQTVSGLVSVCAYLDAIRGHG